MSNTDNILNLTSQMLCQIRNVKVRSTFIRNDEYAKIAHPPHGQIDLWQRDCEHTVRHSHERFLEPWEKLQRSQYDKISMQLPRVVPGILEWSRGSLSPSQNADNNQ